MASADCTAVPVSLSDLRNCENNYCYFSEVVTAAIPLGDSNGLCLEFVPPDSVGASVPVNITVDHSHFKWVADYLYFTDAVHVDTIGFCNCPGSFSGNNAGCNDCAAYPKYTDVVVCNTGIHHDEGCLMTWTGNPGTWCSKTGMQGSDRFKVIKMRPNVITDIGLRIDTTYNNASFTYSLEYHGNVDYFTNGDIPFNFTIVSDTAKVPFTPEYLVFDVTSPTDFYYFTSDEVNSIDGFDYTKIGWYKTNLPKKVNSDLYSSISTKLVECVYDKFTFSYPWINVLDFLSKHTSRLSRYYSPGSMLSDPNFLASGSSFGQDPNHIANPYSYLLKGWIIASADDLAQPFGFLHNGEAIPQVVVNQVVSMSVAQVPSGYMDVWLENLNGTGVLKNIQVNISRPCLLRPAFTGEIDQTTYRASFTQAHRCMINNPSAAGVTDSTIPIGTFYYNIFCYTPNGGVTYPNGCVSNNATFRSRIWPELRYYDLSYNNGIYRQDVIEDQPQINSTHLYTEITQGVINVAIEFKNFTVYFEDTVISPKIISVAAVNETINLVAQSLTVSGTCFVTSDPPELLTAQPITLTVSASKFPLDMNIPAYTGVATVLLTCYKKKAQMALNVDYNIQINQSLAQNQTSQNNITSCLNGLLLNCDAGFSANPFNWGSIFGNWRWSFF